MSKKTLNYLCFIMVLVMSQNTHSQHVSEHLRTVWTNESLKDSVRFRAINMFYKNQTFAQPDSILKLTDFHYEYAKQKESKSEMANALNEAAYAYYIKGDFEVSLKNLKESIKLLEQLGNPLKVASVYSNLGNIYSEQNKYEKAAACYYSTLKIFKKKNIKKGEARILNELANIFTKLDDYTLALKYFDEAIALYKSLGANEKCAEINARRATVFYEKKLFQKSINTSLEAIPSLELNNDRVSIALCYLNIAKSYHQLNQTEKAFEYLNKNLKINQSLHNNSKILEALTLKAALFYKTDPSKATIEAKRALKLVQTDTENELKAELYHLLYKCYKSKNEYKTSLNLLEKYTLYRDSVAYEKRNFTIIKDAIKVSYNERLRNTELENEKVQSQIKVAHLKKTFAIISTALLFIGFVLYFSTKKIRNDRKKRDALLQELAKLREMNNNVSSLAISTLQLHRESIEKSINRTINDTDWNVLNILLEDPVISNKGISIKAHLSIDGIGSSLRRMYEYFEIKESKYKKISLLMEAIKRSTL